MKRSARASHSALAVLGTLALGAIALVPAGCSDEPSVSSEGQKNAACEAQDFEGCGDSCKKSSDCLEGLYCDADSQECSADCIAGKDEDDKYCDGEACMDDGQCEGSRDSSVEGSGQDTISFGEGGAGSGLGTGSGGSASNEDCIDVQVDFEPQIPNVVLLIDQSGSMDDRSNYDDVIENAEEYTPWDCSEGTQDWRWNVVRNVLLNPDSGVVAPLEDRVRFGLTLYTSNGGFGDDADDPKECPVLTEVDVALNNREAMLSSFECDDTRVDTPTRESLRDTANALDAADLEGPKVIILATDGEPDNCECENWNSAAGEECEGIEVTRDGETMTPKQAEQYDVVQEAKRIYEELGIMVSVVDVSGDAADLTQHLSEVATAGGGESYDGTDPSDLVTAFDEIIAGVRSCAIDLDGEIESGKESTGTVLLDGNELMLDDPNGWQVNSPTQIELVGDACETIKSGDHDLDISFPCGAFVPGIK